MAGVRGLECDIGARVGQPDDEYRSGLELAGLR